MKLMVVGFLFNVNRTHVALIKKNRPEWQAGKLNGLGGKVEINELPHDAMVREFKEEAGLLIPHWHPFCSLESSNWKVLCFTSTVENNVLLEQMTDEQVLWHPLKYLSDLPVISNLHWLIPMALDSTPLFSKVQYLE